ncbi:MAG TPA: DUF1116 domain-containing protein [Hyphomicrobiaceae bacterium]
MTPADVDAFRRMTACTPSWTALRPAHEAMDLSAATLLHAGPPFDGAEQIPAPVRNSAIAAILYEGWAGSPAEAASLLQSGQVRLKPAQDCQCVLPLAAILSPSMQVQIVADTAAGGKLSYSPLNGGSGPAMRLGLPTAAVVDHLRWINGPFSEAIRSAIDTGIDLLSIADTALLAGDECHGRTSEGTRAIHGELRKRASAGLPDAVEAFFASSPSFFLNLWMAASKCILSAANGVPGSTMVTGAGGNGSRFGLIISGNPTDWITSPAMAPVGNRDPGISTADCLPAIGDSAIVEALGLGAMALSYSPVQQAALHPFMPLPSETLSELLLIGGHPRMARSRARVGLLAGQVRAVQQAPAVALGILDAAGRRGRVGGGIYVMPLELFDKACGL